MDIATLRDLQAVIRRRYRGGNGINVQMSADGTTVIFSLAGAGPSAPALSLVPVGRASNAVGMTVTGSGTFQPITLVDQVPTVAAPHLITMEMGFQLSGISASSGALVAGYYDFTASGSHLTMSHGISISGAYASGYSPMICQTSKSAALIAGHTYRPWFLFSGTYSGGIPQFVCSDVSWTITPIVTP